MFAKPRPKKSLLPPPSKKRKTTSAVEEVNFDFDAREEYLTGFHKRKQQRIKNAQEEAAKRAREEKILLRKQVREERKREVEEHVETVNKLLRESLGAGNIKQDSEEESAEEWDGFPDQPDLELVDHEEEYIDEDRYTTVTVESVAVSRDGLFKPTLEDDDDEVKKPEQEEETKPAGSSHPPKKKKKKFRYETKIERQLTERKAKAKRAKRRE
ncbi:Fc.00g053500.m01.CDS01 [Cosmosporella sp. VM-42]